MPRGEGSIVRGTAVFASGTMLSRIFGLVRDIVAGYFFAGPALDAWIVAWRIPNTFRQLLAEGATNALYVPVFSEYVEKKGKRAMLDLAGTMATVSVICLAAVTLLGIVCARWLISPVELLRAVSGGEGPTAENFALTVNLLRWTFPYLFLIGVAAVLTGVLYTQRHFAAPAYSPVLLNVSLIASCFALRSQFPHPVFALVVGALIGGVAQLALQSAVAANKGIFPVPRATFGHPGLKQIGILFLPVVVTQGVNQVNLLVDTWFAHSLGEGSVTSLYYASRLYQLPLGAFAVAASTAALPVMSRLAAAKDFDGLVKTFSRGVRLAAFLCFPAVAVMVFAPQPLIRTLFQYGRFSETLTSRAAWPLLFYALGLVSFASVKTATSAMYAIQQTKLAMVAGVAGMLANIALNFALVRHMQTGGLALATALSFTLNLAILLALLKWKIGSLDGQRIAGSLSRMLVAAAGAGLAIRLITPHLERLIGTTGIPARVAVLSALLLVCGTMYVAVCWLLRLEEPREIVRQIRERRSPR